MTQEITEEFLTNLYEVIESIIDERIESAFGRDGLHESVRSSELKQELINVFAFGD